MKEWQPVRLGKSLHIGVSESEINRKPLKYCEDDALAMARIAYSKGWSPTPLFGKEARYETVVRLIKEAAEELEEGDIFWLSFSGHGCKTLDKTGNEFDGYDESLVLSDRILIDDELHHLWSLFKSGVRILVILDCCHSGGFDVEEPKTTSCPVIQASGILLASCAYSQVSREGNGNGAFTEKLLQIWNTGTFRGNYSAMLEKTAILLKPRQRPQYVKFGIDDELFNKQEVFKI
ncbi:caspase family protein [Laspinema olomoucense]|uniref:caspase family protein n=1 Tax=Laspinema olomoucense TaxID=3231600 RepID=UPI0021BACD4B|nr:caspase family protein [Laspinema sp. D3d]MCT7971177.1 caspase family protein [Laspinema sp. D3d]